MKVFLFRLFIVLTVCWSSFSRGEAPGEEFFYVRQASGLFNLIKIGGPYATVYVLGTGPLSYLIGLLPATVAGGSVPILVTGSSLPAGTVAVPAAAGFTIATGTVLFVAGVVAVAAGAVYVNCSPSAQNWIAQFFTGINVNFIASPFSPPVWVGKQLLTCECERIGCQAYPFYLGGDVCDFDDPLSPRTGLPLVAGLCDGYVGQKIPTMAGYTPGGSSYDTILYRQCRPVLWTPPAAPSAPTVGNLAPNPIVEQPPSQPGQGDPNGAYGFCTGCGDPASPPGSALCSSACPYSMNLTKTP